ncbi:MAG: ABC transporter permease subunit [Phycisphaerales bacterium]|nr:ABC transporter permease subunit [Phycisphaerales bacterium]
MRKSMVIMQRELGAYFFSPIAYVVLALFLGLSGYLFSSFVFTAGGEASLRNLLDGWAMPIMLLFFLSLLGMRLLSEEFRMGTVETLLTAPVTEAEVVFGKFLGAGAFYLIMLATTLVFGLFISLYGRLDPLLLLCHYLALIMLGALYISVGLFFSAWTKNQLVAGLLSMVFLLLFSVLAQLVADSLEGWLKAVFQHLSIVTHYSEMIRGRLGFNHVVYFLTTTAFFLFATVKVLESRRWR